MLVADFIDGQGQLIDTTTGCGVVFSPHAQQRMALESTIPLSAELVARLQRLQRAAVISKRATALKWFDTACARRPQGRVLSMIARLSCSMARSPGRQGM